MIYLGRTRAMNKQKKNVSHSRQSTRYSLLHHTRRVSLTIVLVLLSRRPASTGSRPPLAQLPAVPDHHHGCPCRCEDTRQPSRRVGI